LDKPFVKVIPVGVGPTIPVKNAAGVRYRTYLIRVGVRFDEVTEDLYKLLCLAKTLPELLRNALLSKLKAEKKDLKWLSRTQNSSAYTLEALIASLPQHIKSLREQADALEDWLEQFESSAELAPKVRKSRMQTQIAKNLTRTENSA